MSNFLEDPYVNGALKSIIVTDVILLTRNLARINYLRLLETRG